MGIFVQIINSGMQRKTRNSCRLLDPSLALERCRVAGQIGYGA
jgi:hypothetical protein